MLNTTSCCVEFRHGKMMRDEALYHYMMGCRKLHTDDTPVLVSLHEWLVEKGAILSKKSRQGEAFAYALNQ